MSKSLDKIEKDSASDESSDSKTAKSDSPLSQTTKEQRRKSAKKKMPRSGSRRARLSGGADETSSPSSAPDAQRVSIKDEVDSHNGTLAESRSVPDTPPSSPVSCPKDTLAKTGDAKADEMLECALQNLEEAGKALASLGTNLEHELKLFLVDLMNRARKWSSGVEGKMEWCRRDVITLSKELASRMQHLEHSLRESQELRDQLAKNEELRSLADGRNGKTDDGISRVTGVDGAGGGVRGVGGAAGGGGVDACAASIISPCDQPSFTKDGDTDIAAYRAEQERLMACCAELEEEICCLKKENERIVKERAEYENAIQRALLKGVSSLNVEALKVLRCTPIPSCCPPCPPSSSIEPMSKPRDCTSPRSQPRDGGCGNGNGRAGASKSCTSTSSRGNGNGNGGRVCPGSGHERKSKKSKDNNMLLLLHQKDAENFGIQGGGCDSQKKSNDCGKHRRSSHYQC